MLTILKKHTTESRGESSTQRTARHQSIADQMKKQARKGATRDELIALAPVKWEGEGILNKLLELGRLVERNGKIKLVKADS